MTHHLRIVSAVGPGDAVKAHDDWELGVRTPSETSFTFTSHEFEAFAALNASFWIVSSHPRAAIKLVGDSRIENRPRPEASGLAFHLSRARYAISLLRSARAFRATHVIVDSGTTHWFCLMPFRVFGIDVIPNLHNVLWVVGQPRSRRLADRVAHALDRLFWRGVSTALACSPAGSEQIQQMSGGRAKVMTYRAQFAASDFDGLPRPVLHPTDDVRLMFAGRVEQKKGVFDLLAMARNLNTGARRYVFEVCGYGSAFDQLAEEAKRASLGDRFLMLGKLPRVGLLEVYARTHLVIVPTRTDFTEGLPLVAAEAVLAGRPVVTSIVSNAFEPLAGALVECRVEDVDDYCDQIRGVVNAPERYAALVAGTRRAAAQFIDHSHGLDMVLRAVMAPTAARAATRLAHVNVPSELPL